MVIVCGAITLKNAYEIVHREIGLESKLVI
jgi:hypothetical protein